MLDDHQPDLYGELWADVYDVTHSAMTPPEVQVALLAELSRAGRTLELGIGTGRVALPLAARGVRVEGIDASPSMVRAMREKPGGPDIPVTIGDMADLAVQGSFRLVYVVFNTIFALLTQDAQVRCFRRVAEVLEPGGQFLLECFVPDVGRFTRHQSLRTVAVGDEALRIDASLHDPVTQQISTGLVQVTRDGATMRPIRMRYAWPAELDLMAALAGLRYRSRWGDWHQNSFTRESGMHVTVYERHG